MAPMIVMWIHLLAVIAWVGGMVYSMLVIQPTFGKKQTDTISQQLLVRLENRFRAVRWTSIMIILLTGFFNLLYEGGSERIESTWGAILMVKLLFVAIAMGLTGVNDFILGTHPIRGESSPSTPSFRWASYVVLPINILVIFIAVYLSWS